MSWFKYLRATSGSIFGVPSQTGGGINLENLPKWELWSTIIRDYSNKPDIDVWFQHRKAFSNASPGKLVTKPLDNNDEIIRLDHEIIAEYDLKNDRLQIFFRAADARSSNPTPVSQYLINNQIPHFRNPFQVDPFADILLFEHFSLPEQLICVDRKLKNLKPLTSDNIENWRLEYARHQNETPRNDKYEKIRKLRRSLSK